MSAKGRTKRTIAKHNTHAKIPVLVVMVIVVMVIVVMVIVAHAEKVIHKDPKQVIIKQL